MQNITNKYTITQTTTKTLTGKKEPLPQTALEEVTWGFQIQDLQP